MTDSTFPAPAALSEVAQTAREKAREAIAKLPMLGPVVWLMLQQPAYRGALMADLGWRVLPPLMLSQAKLYLRDGAPVAYASWALLSPAAAQRFRQPPHQLAATDWQSGEEPWLIDVVTPFGGALEVLTDLRQGVFAGKALRQLPPQPEAVPIVWPPAG